MKITISTLLMYLIPSDVSGSFLFVSDVLIHNSQFTTINHESLVDQLLKNIKI